MSRLHHLLPENDLRPHEKNGACWCHPIQHFQTSAWLHNAADCRCNYCGAVPSEHEPSGCCGDGGGSTFSQGGEA